MSDKRRSKGLGEKFVSVDGDLEPYFLLFSGSLAKAAAFTSKRKEVGNTVRADSAMLY